MTRRSAAVLALWTGTLVGAAIMVLVIATVIASLGGPGLAIVITILAGDAVAFGTVGMLIARQRPDNRIASVLATAGFLLPVTFIGFTVGALRYALHGPDDLLGGAFAVVGSTSLGPTLFAAVPLLAILFPDGRVPGPRWRLPVAATAAMIGASSLFTLVKPGPVEAELPVNPLAIDTAATAALGQLAIPLLVLGIAAGSVLAIAAVATRFRRSAGVERQQLKWLLAAVVLIGITLTPSFVDGDGDQGFSVLDAVAMSSLALLPLSVGIAVTRHGLYEIDRVVSRTVTYALITAILAATFVITNLALQAVLADATGSSALITAFATLVVAALFQPLRRRVQGLVDRQFNRARYDRQTTAAGFADRVRNEVDLPTLRGALVATADEAVRPTVAGLWLRPRHGP
jgi:hypothetical protein